LPYDWIFFTSANSVSFFVKRLHVLGHDVRVLAAVQLAASDCAVAEALFGYGLLADFIGVDYPNPDNASNLSNMSGQRVLVLCSSLEPPVAAKEPSLTAEGHNAGLVGALREHKARVEVVPAYATLPADPDPIVLSALLSGRLDVATFASSSSVSLLARMLNDRPVADVLAPLTVACISPIIAAAAQALGVRVDLVAEEPTAEALVGALNTWRLKQRRL
jgi:uroporphyrinogen III methyltransferase/synthase